MPAQTELTKSIARLIGVSHNKIASKEANFEKVEKAKVPFSVTKIPLKITYNKSPIENFQYFIFFPSVSIFLSWFLKLVELLTTVSFVS